MITSSKEYIDYICFFYGSSYDDRVENTSLPTAGDNPHNHCDNWMLKATVNHKSLIAFQYNLAE